MSDEDILPDAAKKMVRRERRDAIEHRQLILDKARRLFAEQGVDTVSMRQIARAAGVGQGTLYRQYEHKGSLCEALLGDSIELFKKNFEEKMRQPSELLPLDMVSELLTRLTDFNEQHADLLSALVDTATTVKGHSFSHNSFYDWIRQTIILLLKQARAQNEQIVLDEEYFAYMLLAPFVIDLYLHLRYQLNFTPERIIQSTKQILFDTFHSSP